MAFLNVQIGGSVFRHQETRSKNFQAPADLDPNLSPAVNQRNAHRRMFTNVSAWLEDCAREAELNDMEAIESEKAQGGGTT